MNLFEKEKLKLSFPFLLIKIVVVDITLYYN